MSSQTMHAQSPTHPLADILGTCSLYSVAIPISQYILTTSCTYFLPTPLQVISQAIINKNTCLFNKKV